MNPSISGSALKALTTFNTCEVANAIECFDVRLRNEGFTNNTLQCHFPELPPMVGYAVTLRVHSGNPPMQGGTYAQRTEWWDQLDAVPGPHVVVIQDADRRPGIGAFIGEVHAAILQALGCIGVVTNGAVRDVPEIKPRGFPLFSGNLSVSHAYMHVVEINTPVEVAGLRIHAGDLIHGDQHGIVRIPRQIAPELPEVVARVRAQEREILDFCRSANFSKDGLRKILGEP
jgi:4-hydroxy-4-methyl-2-oxoglutarate aldolase